MVFIGKPLGAQPCAIVRVMPRAALAVAVTRVVSRRVSGRPIGAWIRGFSEVPSVLVAAGDFAALRDEAKLLNV
jgi:hypothetical protein